MTIIRRGRPVAVLLAPETQLRVLRAQACLEMLELSETLKARRLPAAEIFEALRAELPARP